jgi:hypothetical protein
VGSGFNNVKVHGIIDPEFSESFGFSQIEVDAFINNLGFQENKSQISSNIRAWYDGYNLPLRNGSFIEAYTPWAVVNYLDDASRGTLEPESYWSKSGTNVFLRALLKSSLNNDLISKFSLLSQKTPQFLEFDKLISLFDIDFANKNNAEKIFSYLLLNAGYLTAKRIPGENKYLFNVPNDEVVKEILSVTEKVVYEVEKEQETRDLYRMINGLKENKVKTIIDAIVKGDKPLINNLLAVSSTTKIQCDERSLNFNLFHVAAIKGDKETFDTLLKVCNRELLSQADKNTGKLKSIDYAYMSGNKELVAMIEKDTKETRYLDTPSWFNTVACWADGASVFIKSAIPPIPIVLFTNWFIPSGYMAKVLYYGSLYGISSFIVHKTGFDNMLDCTKYTEFSKIDITENAQLFNSLLQFAKHSLIHQSTISLDNTCTNPDASILSIYSAPLFIYHELDYLPLTLCGTTNMLQPITPIHDEP